MIKKNIERIKSILVKKTDGNNKKNIENLVVFLILLIITIVAMNVIYKDDKSDVNENNDNYKQLANKEHNNIITSTNNETSEYNLEQELENILTKINGVGKVNVLITYSETNQVIPVYNEKQSSSNTEETDTNGGIRKIEETDVNKEVVFEEKNGTSNVITQKVIKPKVEGAIVTAEGGENINVKTNIIQAVSAVTGIASYKIQVFEMAK